MNFVVLIHGREAIPLRAVPFLTAWEVMTPDALVTRLANGCAGIPALQAYLFEDGGFQAIDPSWWNERYSVRLTRLQARIQAAGNADADDGYLQWQEESIKLLPAGVFVWKDECENMCNRAFGLHGHPEMDHFDDQDLADMAQAGIQSDGRQLESAGSATFVL